MAQPGTLGGWIRSVIVTVGINASLADVEAKLKDVDKATDAASTRWQQFMASPEATTYQAKRSLDDAAQTQMIVGLENLLGSVAAVTVAQQQVFVAMLGLMRQLNKK
jgi:hypothetical protein